MKILPFSNNVVIKRLEQKASAFHVEQETTGQGEILAIGPDVKSIKVGDKILFVEYAVDSFELDNSTYLLTPEASVVGKIK
tara:strand:- start:1697 stop:1939 length:243 start_codon:yes stop_codon:yes gene_type:complete